MPELFRETPGIIREIRQQNLEKRRLGMAEAQARESMALRERELGSREKSERVRLKLQVMENNISRIVQAGQATSDPRVRQELKGQWEAEITKWANDSDTGEYIRNMIKPHEAMLDQKSPELTEALTKTGETILTPKRAGLITKPAPEKKYPGIIGEYYTVYGKVPTSSEDIKKFKEATQLDTDGYGTIQKGLDEQGKMVFFQIDKTTGTPRVVKGIQPEPKKGMRVTTPDGTIVEIGGSGADITTKTKGSIEEKIIGGKEQLARLQEISSEFKPEYQEIGSRLETAWTGIKSKFGSDVAPDDAKKLTEFKAFQRKAITNINLFIKEITGAQMSEKEADRIRLSQPDPGEHWWQGDDPITFKAKMDDAIKAARAAIARYEFYRNMGLDDKQIKAIVTSNTAIDLNAIMTRMP